MQNIVGVLLTFLLGLVCIQGFAIEPRWNGVNEEVYSKYVCNGKQNGVRIMVVGSCSKYYECQSGESNLKTCKSPNKFFDSVSGKCVATSSCIEPKGDCSTSKPKPTPPCNNNNKQTTTTTTAKPTKTTTTEKPPKPHDTPCETKRKEEQQKLMEELENHYAEMFGSSGQKCDSAGGSCRGLANGSFVPYKNNCNKYLVCFNGCAAEFVCPASLHFNRSTRLCDTPENSKCDV